MKRWNLFSKEDESKVYRNQNLLDLFSIMSLTEKTSLPELKDSLQTADEFITTRWLVTREEHPYEKISGRINGFIRRLQV